MKMEKMVEIGFGFGYYTDMAWMAVYGFADHTIWLNMGKKFEFKLLVWLHTCVTINLEDGSATMYENGIKMAEDKNEKLVTNVLSDRGLKSLLVGCHVGTNRQDTHSGVLTDFQLFGRVLSQEELVSWTTCEMRLEGDVVNWETDSWTFKRTGDGSEIEYLDFKRSICDMKERSYHLFPLRAEFKKAVYMCERVSGKLSM